MLFIKPKVFCKYTFSCNRLFDFFTNLRRKHKKLERKPSRLGFKILLFFDLCSVRLSYMVNWLMNFFLDLLRKLSVSVHHSMDHNSENSNNAAKSNSVIINRLHINGLHLVHLKTINIPQPLLSHNHHQTNKKHQINLLNHPNH